MPATARIQHHFTRDHVARPIGRQHQRVAVEAATITPEGRPGVERVAVFEGKAAKRYAALLTEAPEMFEIIQMGVAMCEGQGAFDCQFARRGRAVLRAIREASID